MPIDITERYKLIFRQLNHATDFRAKIIQGWCLIYAALATAFVWVQSNSNSKPLSWIVTAVGISITWLMWGADKRNRDAFSKWRPIGKEIEQEAGIPEMQQFFLEKETRGNEKSAKDSTHSDLIDIFACVMIIILIYATGYLLFKGGNLPGSK